MEPLKAFGIFIFGAFLLFNQPSVAAENSLRLILIGKIPGEYLTDIPLQPFPNKESKAWPAALWINDGIIEKIQALPPSQSPIQTALTPKDFFGTPRRDHPKILTLLNSQSGELDIIYPGLIDLHSHAKYNMLPLWSQSKGQFTTRFDWRSYTNYKKSVSANMNIWSKSTRPPSPPNPLECAAYRWDELQAMALGTTLLQGRRFCVENFAIETAENSAYLEPHRLAVSTATTLFSPQDIYFFWQHHIPLIEQGMTYPEALSHVLKDFCPDLPNSITQNIMTPKTLTQLTEKHWLRRQCKKPAEAGYKKIPKGYFRFYERTHPLELAPKINYLNNPNHSALLLHLAEGRRQDPYNKIEFQILKKIGLAKPQVSLVHALGLESHEYATMIQQKMGLIWSPFSNLLLYGETLNFDNIIQATELTGGNLTMALGSDWTPTGTRSVLEELKIARRFLLKTPRWFHKIGDRELYNMVTHGPAQLLNLPHRLGTLKPGAVASLTIASQLHGNPYTNLVRDVQARDINLVVVRGKVIYGDTHYLHSLDHYQYENLNEQLNSLSHWITPQGETNIAKIQNLELPRAPNKFQTDEENLNFSQRLGTWVHHAIEVKKPEPLFHWKKGCEWPRPKGFVTRPSNDPMVRDYKLKTGVDLDKFRDIQTLVSVSVTTQNRNTLKGKAPKDKFRLKDSPRLLSCNDASYLQRIENFIQPDGSGEMSENLANANKIGKISKKICKLFFGEIIKCE